MMLVVATLLAGCATPRRLAAASDVHTLLKAIRDDDRAAFDAHVDRRTLRAGLQARLAARAEASNWSEGWKGVGVWLSGPASRAADALLVQPEVFRAVADHYGYRRRTPIPGVLALSSVLGSLPGGEVCARVARREPCLLTFAEEGGVWRLVDIDIDNALWGRREERR